MANESSPEYKTLLQCNSLLISHLSQDVLTICEELVSISIIPPAKRNFVRDNLSDKQKVSSELIDTIQTRVKKHPHIYYEFLKVLNAKSWLKDVVIDLDKVLNSGKKDSW